MARAACAYIVAKRPRIVTLENVYQYRNFESWHEIARTLLNEGYAYNYWHVNMADYGVPQTRRRMIVVARRDGVLPELPEKTHAKEPTPGLFGTKTRWVSWYEAIEDLLPGLPDGKLAPFQSVLPLPKVCLIDGNNARPDTGQATFAEKSIPAFTITANNKGVHRIKIGNIIKEVSPRCRARLQSFPDWCKLPDSASLAAKGIGNAVPPLFAERLYNELQYIYNQRR
jgi:DNA (cytosine-5)-methyltransferase 1